MRFEVRLAEVQGVRQDVPGLFGHLSRETLGIVEDELKGAQHLLIQQVFFIEGIRHASICIPFR